MQYTYHCFDWDDNLIFMPTNIVLFHKEGTEEVVMTTEDFALHRGDIGKDIPFFLDAKGNFSQKETKNKRSFKDYKIIGDDEHPSLNSFREFRDCENKYFLKHLKEAVLSQDFGPEWDKFVRATSDKEHAKRVYIITARGHSAQTIYEGIKYLQEIGLIKNYIPRKNIYPVSNKKFKGAASSPAATKLKILKSVFTEAQKQSRKDQVHHTVYFSDDDHKTFDHLHEKITQMRANTSYWMNIHIRLRFTGTKKIKRKVVTL